MTFYDDNLGERWFEPSALLATIATHLKISVGDAQKLVGDINQDKTVRYDGSVLPSDILCSGFVWAESPKGQEFWDNVHKEMLEKEAGDNDH